MAAAVLLVLGAGVVASAARLDVVPAPVPADNGTPACASARDYLQQVNERISGFAKRVDAAGARVGRAQTRLATDKRRRAASPDDATLRLAVEADGRELRDARHDLARLDQEGKLLQSFANKLGTLASVECQAEAPTADETNDDLAVPADNGTPACAQARNQMASLLSQVERLRANEAFKAAGPLGLSAVARRQIETRIARLTAKLRELAPNAATACAKAAFAGTWTGTFQEAADVCVPSGKSGPATMTLVQNGDSLSGTATYSGYVIGDDCPSVDLHGTITGTVTGNVAHIQSVYDNDGGAFGGTLTLAGTTLTLAEDSGDGATFARG